MKIQKNGYFLLAPYLSQFSYFIIAIVIGSYLSPISLVLVRW